MNKGDIEQKMEISVVIPVYGCPEALNQLHERLVNTLNTITQSYEIIFVNDGCPKNSWKVVKEICNQDKKVVGINLTRNFGQVYATNAGLEQSTGETVIVMDCDLQDRPEGIIELYEEYQKGYDVVYVKRLDRKDGFITRACSKLFYSVYNYYIDGKFDSDIANYCIASRRVVDEYCKMQQRGKSYTTELCWMDYNSSTISIESDEREAGKSSYSFKKKINLAIEMITVQSNKPLVSSIKAGFVIVALSILYIIYKVIYNLLGYDVPIGWTSIIAAIFLMGGMQMVCLGVVGIYVGNIFNQSKGKPEYLIQEVLNKSE